MGDILIKFIKSTYELTESLRFAVRAAHDVRILYVGRDCAEAAIVYNKPEVLKLILQVYAIVITHKMKMHLYDICSVLKREGCLDVLKRSRFPEPVTKVFDPANSLFSLVTKYMYYKDIGSEILSRLREVATIEQDINAPGIAGMTRLQLCVTGHRKDYTHFICVEELKVLLQLNADVDVIDEAGSTVLSNILHTTQYTYMIKNKREALELILLENPSAELTKNAVEKAFAFDEIIETEEFNHMGFACMGQ